MGRLRGEFHSPLTILGPGSLLDKLGNFMGDLLVRDTRDLAWNAAVGVWQHRDTSEYRTRRDSEERQLDQCSARAKPRTRQPTLPGPANRAYARVTRYDPDPLLTADWLQLLLPRRRHRSSTSWAGRVGAPPGPRERCRQNLW